MGWFLTLVSVYILGGITFLPILIFLFIYLHPILSSDDIDHLSESPGHRNAEESKHLPTSDLKAGEIEEDNKSGLDTYKAGWIIVTQDYLESPDDINSSTQSIVESSDNKSAYSALYKLVQKDNNEKSPETITDFDTFNDDVSTLNTTPTTNTSKTPNAASTLPPQQASSTTATTPTKSSQKKHRYYGVLKHGNLFLYKDETVKEVKHVIVLSSYFISIWPRHLSDGQLFTKSSAIALINVNKLSSFNDKRTDINMSDGTSIESAPKGSFFLYCDVNIDKEDWYFALIRATKTSELHESLNPKIYAKTLHFKTSHMINLIQSLYSSEGQLQTKWLNAIIGRMFLSLQNTKVLEEYLYTKFSKKLNKIKKPGFLDKFQINSLYAGDSAPFLTYPSLKEISPDGTILISAYVTYNGNLSLQIATKANINLGSRFKTREVDLLLSITLAKLEGPILIKIKPPPTERLWYSFETEPKINLKIEPIISSRQMTYNLITNSIDKKLKEAVKDSLVLPHWDDIVFYNTMDEIYKGGIWDPNEREKPVRPTSTSSASSVHNSTTTTTNGNGNGNGIDLENDDSKSITSSINGNGTGNGNSTGAQYDDLDEKSELSFKSQISKSTKLSNTLSDLSKRLKKKTTSPEPNELFVENHNVHPSRASTAPVSGNNTTNTMSTLRKIGKWYFKDDKANHDDNYSPPEMISSRRAPKKHFEPVSIPESESPSPVRNSPTYDFGKFNYNDSVFDNKNTGGTTGATGTGTTGGSISRKVSSSTMNSSLYEKQPISTPPLPPRDDDTNSEIGSIHHEKPSHSETSTAPLPIDMTPGVSIESAGISISPKEATTGLVNAQVTASTSGATLQRSQSTIKRKPPPPALPPREPLPSSHAAPGEAAPPPDTESGEPTESSKPTESSETEKSPEAIETEQSDI
ncbi:uncharacterized protein RJT21DRAFT_123179 [Scheffersomyces amazonensis]|uniref:uncharacterized protein n=1 Tax=Scheffersomyces amazonensis TaxID=1078765 RepID=UPI00315D2898